MMNSAQNRTNTIIDLTASCRDPKLNEATAYPFWCIVTKAGVAGYGRFVLIAGPWFSRETATVELTTRAYRYPKSAFVYCFSGHMSADYRELLDTIKAEDDKDPHEDDYE